MITGLLLYLTLIVYYGLFNVRIASFYSLDSSGQTDSFSLLYSVRILCGLAAPLCFNFLKLTNIANTQFHETLNPMDAIPLIGDTFQTFFPCSLLVLCLLNYFDVWTKIVSSMGLEELAFGAVFDPSRVESGRKLARVERHRMQSNSSTEMTGTRARSCSSSDDESTSFIK